MSAASSTPKAPVEKGAALADAARRYPGDAAVAAYWASLPDKERIMCDLAAHMFKSRWDMKRTNGFIKWFATYSAGSVPAAAPSQVADVLFDGITAEEADALAARAAEWKADELGGK